LDSESFQKLDSVDKYRDKIIDFASSEQPLPVKFSAYKRGSAFVHTNV